MPEPNSDPTPSAPTPPPDPIRDGARMFVLLGTELRRLAGAIARREIGHTMQPTALVNELYMKFLGGQPRAWNDAMHFMRSAAMTMRRILIEHKRARATRKRGGDIELEPLDLVVDQLEARCGGDLLCVNEVLGQLAQEDAEVADYVTLRFFCGHTNTEAAQLLGICERLGDKHWALAKAWLLPRLRP
jgi:RNA polymerase sigma-70 factor, ECF subfamily